MAKGVEGIYVSSRYLSYILLVNIHLGTVILQEMNQLFSILNTYILIHFLYRIYCSGYCQQLLILVVLTEELNLLNI